MDNVNWFYVVAILAGLVGLGVLVRYLFVLFGEPLDESDEEYL